ncbi:MAG: RidA family protein [Rhodoferax sp.]|nr:RidA family protein [Rhodoferax sp.]
MTITPPPATAGQPLARYAASKRLGDILYCSGVIAVDPASGQVQERYAQLPDHARAALQGIGYDTGQLSVDVFEAPIVVQSWVVLERIRTLAQAEGATMEQVARLVQYFRDLRHYPAYNRVRNLFFTEPVVSTVVEVARMLPDDRVWIEVEATFFLGQSGT